MKKSPKKRRRRLLRVSVVLAAREHERLAEMAKKTERSMSWLGRYGVRRLLEDYETRQLSLPLEIPENIEGV